MTTKELIKAEIDRLDDELLDELYNVIKKLATAKKSTAKKSSFMSRLKDIKIDAPEDFSANLDSYTSGDKLKYRIDLEHRCPRYNLAILKLYYPSKNDERPFLDQQSP